MEKLNTSTPENNLKLLPTSQNLESSRQESLFVTDFIPLRNPVHKPEAVNSTLRSKISQAQWARGFIQTHELHVNSLKNCVEFYKLSKSEQDSVRYQLKKLARQYTATQRDINLNNLKSLAPTDPLIDSTSTKFRARLLVDEWKECGMSILLYSTLALVVGLLTAESFTYYMSREMSFEKAIAFSVVVELMLLSFFWSKQRKIKILGWAVFLYSTLTCGLWVLHQDKKRSEVSQIHLKQETALKAELLSLESKSTVTEKEIELLIQTQKKFLEMGHLSKSVRVGDEIKEKKEYLTSISKRINFLTEKGSSQISVLKAGAFEIDSYSQFGLRVLFQLFVASFSSLLSSRKRKRA